jgi:hypothetical protein
MLISSAKFSLVELLRKTVNVTESGYSAGTGDSRSDVAFNGRVRGVNGPVGPRAILSVLIRQLTP